MRSHKIVIVRKGKTIPQVRPMYTNAVRWTRRGFTPQEATRLQEISPAGLKAPYIRYMVARRSGMMRYAKNHDWTKEQIRDWIYRDYQNHDVRPIESENYATYFSKTFYDYLKSYHKLADANRSGDNPYWRLNMGWTGIYTSNQEHAPTKVVGVRKTQLKGDRERVIENINKAIMRGDSKERARLERELNRIDRELYD